MRITFKTTGGVAHFPGLAAPKTVDVSALDADRQQQIQELLRSTRFFELPSRPALKRGAADYQTHTITVTEADREHTIAVTDPLSPELGRLINLLRDATQG